MVDPYVRELFHFPVEGRHILLGCALAELVAMALSVKAVGVVIF